MNARSRQPRVSALLVLAVLLIAAPGALAMPKPPDLPAASPSFALYVTPFLGTGYTPLDPATLADLPGASPVTFTGVAPQLLLSADGATAVLIRRTAAEPVTVDIQNGINGPERLHFTIGTNAGMALLSREGTRLAISTYVSSMEQRWRVFDTHTGRLVATVTCTGQTSTPYLDAISPDGQLLYHPFYETGTARQPSRAMNQVPLARAKRAAPEPPWQLWIGAWDATSGKKIAQITIPGVTAGTWPDGAIDGDPVAHVVQPAVALSPDGTRLAVVDAAGTRVTLLDARTLRVTGSHALHRPASAAHRFLGWIGLAPRVAEAKFMVGDQLSAVFASDGQHLYLTGTETSVDAARKTTTGKALGVRRINVNTGAITATGLSGSQMQTMIAAPDGRSLYVSGPASPWWVSQSGQETWVLRRLDATTLRPLAERTMPASSAATLVLAPANATR